MAPKCPDCGTPMRPLPLDAEPPREWICEVALRGQSLGKIGKPKYKHEAVWIYARKEKK